MWICPKCKESIEDQFDSCWKCAGAALHEPPPNDSLLVWMYPAFSLLSLFGIGALADFFWRSPHHAGGYFSLGGAVFGIIVSAICIWMFFSCPLRHWFVKLLTLLFLIPALGFGVITVGSFVFHVLGYDAA
jgi:hypothetical protein